MRGCESNNPATVRALDQYSLVDSGGETPVESANIKCALSAQVGMN